ncbi:MAG: DsbA family protein [Pseudomonadota bacterium]
MTVLAPITRRNVLSLMAASAAVATPLSIMPASALAQGRLDLFTGLNLKDQVMGDVNAKVTLVEYASMTCPHCRTFHEKILPELKTKYVDTGKVKYILRPFPFDKDRRGEAAFMLALCAPNNNYYAMIDALFSTQRVWAGSGNPVPELMRLSKLAGMSEEEFNTCLRNQELLTQMVQDRNKAVKDFGVTATPTVFINGEKLGDSSLETVAKAIEAAL